MSVLRSSAVCLVLSCGAAFSAEDLDFVRDVQPILVRHCTRCHGDQQMEGGLRLTTREAAFAPADSETPVIVARAPDKSLLLARVSSTEYGDRMPLDADPLSDKDIGTLRQWIAAGADWPAGATGKHWAYTRPVRDDVPPTTAGEKAVNAIDHFVLKRLRETGHTASREADRARLIRRVSLVLTGLPPTIEEVKAFVDDTDPDAWEKVVDRLLDSPAYGERWAQNWLDLARYADSNGFQADQLRQIWAYRDWVIRALNDDMPFDQFVIEQLAGDLLPDATLAQKIATGFHRTVPCNVEAGVHPEENRVNQVFDRINTTGTVFLGTTIECCQCHDHKYDPFTQKDYYQLFAYFNNTPLEVKLGGGVQYELFGPKLALPLLPEDQKLRDKLEARRDALQEQLTQQGGSDEERAAWEERLLASVRNPPAWTVLPVQTFKVTGGEDFEILDDQSVLVTGSLPGTSVYTVTSRAGLSGVTAFRVEALTHESLPGMGPGRGDAERCNFILSEFGVEVRRGKVRNEIELHSASADFSQKNWDVARAIDGNRRTGWAIAPQFHKPHHAIFQTAEPLEVADADTLVFTLDQNYGRGRTIGRVRISAWTADPAALQLTPALTRILRKPAGKRTAAQQSKLDELYAAGDPERTRIAREIAAVGKQLAALEPPSTLVMEELDEPRKTAILTRGNYLDPAEAVTPGTPDTLHTLDDRFPRNRLGLAQWLVSPENPLLARVTVNRMWSAVFGRGIVITPEDFGTQAERPTHPELLDWLSVEFQESGWSVKHMHKLMVMSATFRQSSNVTPALLETDPVNALYTRGPRFRLPAESIRDNALAISGLLSRKMGGPPVMPYQPDGVWRAVGRNAPKWKAAADENRYRRGLYVVWRRAAPYPSFVNFDAPDRAACVVDRPRTNTPLQALTLLNDPAYLEMALALAQRLVHEVPTESVSARIDHGLRLCLARKANPHEQTTLTRLYETELARLRATPTLAQELFRSVPGFQPDKDVDPVELAAWFVVANVLLNLDETMTVG